MPLLLELAGFRGERRSIDMTVRWTLKNEVQIHRAAHWRLYALQTEAERGESGFDLPLEIASSHDITLANLHIYRVISSFQPFPWAIKVSNSPDLHFRNVHCYSNSKVNYDATVFDQSHQLEIRQHEFAWLDLSGRPSAPRQHASSPLAADGARVEKLAGGFYNITGGAVGPRGDFFFVEAQSNRIYRWAASSRKLSTVSDRPLSPINLLADQAGNVVVVSYAGNGTVYSLSTNGDVSPLKQEAVNARFGASLYLPVSDWRLNRESLSNPAAHFVSPDGTAVLPVGADFMRGATSWGVKSSPPIRSFGLPGRYLANPSMSAKRRPSPPGRLTSLLMAACGISGGSPTKGAKA